MASTVPATLLRGGRVVDVVAGESGPADVLVVDGRVAEVGSNLPRPEGTEVVDVAGRWVMPGLIDSHVHVTAGDADLAAQAEASPYWVAARTGQILAAMLGRGFTTVRDVGGADHGVAAAVAAGLWEGPRVFFGGKALSPTGGHADLRGAGQQLLDDHGCCPSIGLVCDGVAEVRRGARHQLRTGADHVKIMLSGGVASPSDRVDSLQFSEEEIRAVVEEAGNANRYVAGHAYTARAVNRGLRLGVRSIEHGNLIDAESVSLFHEHDAFLVPTLVTYQYLQAEGAAAGLPAGSQAKVAEVLHSGLDALDLAARGGVRIALGTDLLGSMHPHQSEEIAIRAQVQPLVDVVRSATVVGAALLGREGELGVVAPGAVADLLVLDADPLSDPQVLTGGGRHLRLLLQQGRLSRR